MSLNLEFNIDPIKRFMAPPFSKIIQELLNMAAQRSLTSLSKIR